MSQSRVLIPGLFRDTVACFAGALPVCDGGQSLFGSGGFTLG